MAKTSMKSWLLFFLNEIRYSYWFIPLILALGAIALSSLSIYIDSVVEPGFARWAGSFYSNTPEGARSLLATIAGSMITVAGVTFSITIAAVANSTNQFGPRLLTSFLKDRGNQVTLGVFIATFLYCILVLHTVVSADGGRTEFVPGFALLVAQVMTLGSIGVLIYFLHHVPQSVHVSHMIANVGLDLLAGIDRLFPQRIGEAGDDTSANDLIALKERYESVVPVQSVVVGYVQQIDGARLIALAVEHDVLVEIECRPGSFALPDLPLAKLYARESLNDGIAQKFQACFTFDVKRSPAQDILFLVEQLVEVAAKAVSPGVNDPFTAINSLDWLAAAAGTLAQRSVPSAIRVDDDGNPRLLAKAVEFSEFCETAFTALRPYIAADPNVSIHLMRLFATLSRESLTTDRRAVIQRQAAALQSLCEERFSDPNDKAKLAHWHGTFALQSSSPQSSSPM